MSRSALDVRLASRLAATALANVSREYPNKSDHVVADPRDQGTHRDRHPVFFGSFDWHSCVHGYWLLVRLCNLFNELPERRRIIDLVKGSISNRAIETEMAYFKQPLNSAFGRPYGWAWLLTLQSELAADESVFQSSVAPILRPMADYLGKMLVEHLRNLAYPEFERELIQTLLSVRCSRYILRRMTSTKSQET